MLFPALHDPSDKPAIRFPERTLTYGELRDASAAAAARVEGAERVAVWALPAPETCVAVIGALLAGVPIVPINPKSGERELAHIVSDSSPDLILSAPGADLPGGVTALARADVELDARGAELPPEAGDESPALVVYTSGTTGPPKGAVLPRRAIASNLDALASAWEWTEEDVVAHALPLFHVHGLVLGILGPIRRGGTARHLGRFSSEAVAAAFKDDATVLFAVPTMYHRGGRPAGR